MKFEKTKDNDVTTRDAACYRKFLAGNKTLFTQAFWENGPRRRENNSDKQQSKMVLPGVKSVQS